MRIIIFSFMQRILITGANGQLAREYQQYLYNYNYLKLDVLALDRGSLDITSLGKVNEVFDSYRPDIVINCAAYNLVDKAEVDTEEAFNVNAKGVKNLAISSKKYNSLIVHYSTDYVFDGSKESPYLEADEPNPINKYGETKLLGERLLIEETENYLIFRVSWVFGLGRQNFLYKISEWARERDVLKIVCDQVSIPTYTEDIVKVSMLAINKGLRGLFHLTNSGYASRYEVSKYFLEKRGLNIMIIPVSSEYFPTPAKRPYFSVMSNSRISNILDIKIPDWREGIERFIKRIP